MFVLILAGCSSPAGEYGYLLTGGESERYNAEAAAPIPTATLTPTPTPTPPPARRLDTTNVPDGVNIFHFEYQTAQYTYEGQWKDGLPNGDGVLTWSSNRVHAIITATFVDGLVHGLATLEYTEHPNSDLLGTRSAEFTNGVQNNDSYELVVGVPPWGMR